MPWFGKKDSGHKSPKLPKDDPCEYV